MCPIGHFDNSGTFSGLNLWPIVPKLSTFITEAQINCTNQCGALGSIVRQPVRFDEPRGQYVKRPCDFSQGLDIT